MVFKEEMSELEIKQMETISLLQDKINLMKFDVSENKKYINILKRSLLNRKKTIKIIIKELEKIKKEENYNNISNVLAILNSSLREKQ